MNIKKILMFVLLLVMLSCDKGQFKYLIDKDTGNTNTDNAKDRGCPANTR